MQPEVRKLTTRHGVAAAVVAFVTQPVPGADELLVVPMQYVFAAKLTKKRQVKFLDAPWGRVSKIIWGGAGVRLVANFTLGLVPFAGAFSNAITAAALTEYLGRYLDAALDDPEHPPPPVRLAEIKEWIARAIPKAKGKGAA